ncbi:MAG: SH3 domain-containing protein [Anaerolineae bacterium]
MHSDNWTEETIPSRRVGPEYSEAEGHTPSGLSAVSAYVWLLGFVVLLLALVVCGLWALYLLRGRVALSGPTPTPIIWTPTPAPSPTPSPTETAEPAPTISPDIAIGRYVRVAGTGGQGLNLRSGPGENYVRMDIALEGEVFIVVDGPTPSGGSEWWKVRDSEDEEREWWAVGNFLEPIEHP